MSVKTVFGKTDKADLHNILLQGSVTGPIITSNTVSKHSNKSFKEGNVYMYMKKVPIAPLSLVDDVATISECNTIASIDTNVKNDVFVKTKKMQLQVAKGKCQYIHCGNGECPSSYYADNTRLGEVDRAKYLGDMVSFDWDVLYDTRADKAVGYSVQCLAMASEISLGYRIFSVAVTLYKAIFLSGKLY